MKKYFGIEDMGMWRRFFLRELMSPKFHQHLHDVVLHYAAKDIKLCPKSAIQVFRAFKMCPLEKCRVVILGQDPYPNRKLATGLAFSVPPESTKIPPSLRNIFKELVDEELIGDIPRHGCLDKWSRDEGIMLLNTCLTSEEGQAGAHQGPEWGWEAFVLRALKHLLKHKPDVVILAMGKSAQEVAELSGAKHIVSAAHPSPLSAHRGFFGSGCFKEVNEKLKELGKREVSWNV